MDNSTTSTDAEGGAGADAGGSGGVVVVWSPVFMTALISGIQGIVFYCFFLIQRRKEKANNNYDLYEPRQNVKSHRSPNPFINGWIKEALTAPDDETLRCVGLDTFMFLRLLRMGARICALGSFFACILVPVYSTGNARGPSTDGFNQLTLARVEEGSDRLWATLVAWCFFVGFCLFEFYSEWQKFANKRSDFMAKGDPDTPKEVRYAVRVEQIPRQYRTDKALKEYFRRLFPNLVHDTKVCFETQHLQTLIDERQVNILKLESVVAFTRAKPENPRPKVKVDVDKLTGTETGTLTLCGGKEKKEVDAIEHYEGEIERLNQEIDEERKGYHVAKPSTTATVPSASAEKVELTETDLSDEDMYATNNNSNNDGKTKATSTGFVTLQNLRTKQQAVQCELTGNPDSMVVFPADDPKSILWQNVGAPLSRQRAATLQVAVFFTVGILFWAVPVSFVTSIANLNSILKALGLPTADPNAAWYGLVAGLLPVIFLAILMAVLYMLIVAAATKFIRMKSVPDVDAYTLFWHQMYQFANLWLILIGGSLFNQIDAIINDPTSIIEVIATAMPGASMFFVNMILVGSFGAFGMELSMFPTYVVGLIMKRIKPEPMRTQREIDASKEPPSIVWGKKIPPIVFVFLVSIIYMPIVPLMEVFAGVYFAGTYLVMKHQCMHVYDNKFEGGGKVTWSGVFGFLMASLYMGEAIFIAYMGLKKAPIQGALGFLPLGATILFDTVLKRNIIKPLENLSLEAAAGVDIEEGELLIPANTAPTDDESTMQMLYGVPALDTSIMEERGPMPYRRNEEEVAATAAAVSNTNDVEIGTPSED